ncbi:MAG: hypothetical protein U0235_00535 [Polyangiaceae bacterium]
MRSSYGAGGGGGSSLVPSGGSAEPGVDTVGGGSSDIDWVPDAANGGAYGIGLFHGRVVIRY